MDELVALVRRPLLMRLVLERTYPAYQLAILSARPLQMLKTEHAKQAETNTTQQTMKVGNYDELRVAAALLYCYGPSPYVKDWCGRTFQHPLPAHLPQIWHLQQITRSRHVLPDVLPDVATCCFLRSALVQQPKRATRNIGLAVTTNTR